MTEDRFEEVLKDMAQDYHRPPHDTPREEMWTRIRAARSAGRPAGRSAGPPVRWAVWVVAAAATLAMGVGIGRFTARPGDQSVQLAVGTTDDPIEAAGASVAYRVAAGEHLQRVEAFLTLFRTDARSGRTPDVAPARALLINTRLLQQSQAARDPTLRTLLDDVELVLAQIALYESADDGEELNLITQGIEQRDVLLKLRSATSDPRVRALPGA